MPVGTVTFLFTDIEDSTVRWERDRKAMTQAVRRHDALLRRAITVNGGDVFKTVGDAFCAVFTQPKSAVAAALDAQRQLASEDFSPVEGLAVRMAMHSGSADAREGDYFGPAVNRVARIISIVYGGQIVLSELTSRLVWDELPADAKLVDLGAHRLKDLAEPERLHQLVVADLPHDFPALPSLERLPNNLPAQLTRFFGRDDDVRAVNNLLSDSRLVTLVGAGGVGKTRLALQVGAELLETSEDGVWFVDLGPVGDPQHVPNALATVLGIQESADSPIEESVVSALRRKKTLLILDNCEHVVAAVAALTSAILRECPDIRILATSRQPLGLTGEYAYRVSSLAVPPERAPLSKEEALQYGAIALFVDRARVATGSFELSVSNIEAVAQICRRLDGIALAIELAAPRLRVVSLDQLASRLSERFRLLTGGSRDVLPRQQTMRALIDWSYDLLNDDERRFFRQLAVFVSAFSLDAATALCGGGKSDEWRTLELLSSLVDKSLLASESCGSELRYRLLQSMRMYALEKANEFDDVTSLRHRHAEYYTALAERAQAAYADAQSTTAWRLRLEPELENFRAALDWTLGEHANAKLGARLLTSLRMFWPMCGLAAAVCRWAESALAEDVPPPLQAALWLTLAVARAELMLSAQTLEASVQARDLYEGLDDRAGLAHALRWEALAQSRLGAFVEAEAASRRSLALYRELHDRRGIAATLVTAVAILNKRGRQGEARSAMLEALQLQRTLGDEHGVCMALINIAETEFLFGEVETAIARAQENLKDDALRADPGFLPLQQANLAAYLFAFDRLDEARAQALRALATARAMENHVQVAHALQHLAAIAAQTDPARAARILAYADSIFTQYGYEREYTERYTYERLTTRLRERLSEDEIVALAHEGAALTEEQAVELAQNL